MSGYRDRAYAQSWRDVGTPIELPRSRSYLIGRVIPGTAWHDAMGPYPLLCCGDWEGLADDLAELDPECVTVTAVSDPFGPDEALLRRAFPDLVVPFKRHYLVDLGQPIEAIADRHHRYYARRTLRAMHAEEVERPIDFLDDWTRLYGVLVERHQLAGMKAFSRDVFARQLAVPEAAVLRIHRENVTLAMQIWYVDGDVAYSHLTAISPEGYDLRASYGLYAFAIETLRDRVRWLDLGGTSGLADDDRDGLSAFKKGWSNATRTAFLCGRVHHRERHDELVGRLDANDGRYFPAYRRGELQ